MNHAMNDDDPEAPAPSKIVEDSARARRANARRLRLQYEAHRLVVEEGWRQEQVRLKLGLKTCQTVGRMVADEEVLRAVENQHVRRATIARSCVLYDRIIEIHEARMCGPDPRGDEAKYILRAQYQKERVLGVVVDRASIEVEATMATPFTGTTNSANVSKILRMAIAAAP